MTITIDGLIDDKITRFDDEIMFSGFQDKDIGKVKKLKFILDDGYGGETSYELEVLIVDS